MNDAESETNPCSDGLIRSYFDGEKGLLDRSIFVDPDLYEMEMKQIFSRAWNFMCHESQIPNVGDYFINYIGEDQVIVVRDKQGEVQVLLNTCRHRGNALCRAEQGNAKSFVCSYHGWNYGLNGDLIGVPGMTQYYRKDFDKSEWGLGKAAQVDNFHGFYFATLDAEAPSLYDYLGEVGRTGLGVAASNGDDIVVVNGIQKNVIDCNWKIAVDNLFDWYHVMYSHMSAGESGFMDLSKILHPKNQLVMLGEYGHGISGPGIPAELQEILSPMSEEERKAFAAKMVEEEGGVSLPIRKPEAEDMMGPVGVRSIGHPNIFPNLWIANNGTQLSLRLPRGPFETEIWWFTILPKSLSEEKRAEALSFSRNLFGPAGLLEQDDGENWSQSTRASKGIASRTYDHNMTMALGKDEMREDPVSGQKYIETSINEHGQRWTYQAWTDWMLAKDWNDLKENHTPVPTGRV
ncbi:MAG: Rieske 2Fe-2S domain-containing protein [Parvibaculaceae bacterium]|nr:Rieske 2Fe-2S domain-containing protein [Parvibaculaceae bacterium]